MAYARKALARLGYTLETKDGLGDSAMARLNAIVTDTIKDVNKEVGNQTDEENGGGDEDEDEDEEGSGDD
jgi:hypothetical protein